MTDEDKSFGLVCAALGAMLGCAAGLSAGMRAGDREARRELLRAQPCEAVCHLRVADDGIGHGRYTVEQLDCSTGRFEPAYLGRDFDVAVNAEKTLGCFRSARPIDASKVPSSTLPDVPGYRGAFMECDASGCFSVPGH